MLPSSLAVSGLETYVKAGLMEREAKGLICATDVPVCLSTFHIVPEAPGTYRYPLASAGWNTGSHPTRPAEPLRKSVSLGSGFQSLANIHDWLGLPLVQS